MAIRSAQTPSPATHLLPIKVVKFHAALREVKSLLWATVPKKCSASGMTIWERLRGIQLALSGRGLSKESSFAWRLGKNPRQLVFCRIFDNGRPASKRLHVRMRIPRGDLQNKRSAFISFTSATWMCSFSKSSEYCGTLACRTFSTSRRQPLVQECPRAWSKNRAQCIGSIVDSTFLLRPFQPECCPIVCIGVARSCPRTIDKVEVISKFVFRLCDE